MPWKHPRLLHDSLTISAETYPDKVAVMTAEERLTYRELQEKALRLAAALRVHGIKRGDRVALYLDNSAEAVVGIYAALYADAAFMIINPQTKEDKLRYMLADSGASAILTGGRLTRAVESAFSSLPDLHTLIRVGEATEASESLAKLLSTNGPLSGASSVIPLDLAALVYTSGSTGNPKGVMLSHQNMVFTQASVAEYLRLSSDDRILNLLPLAFDYGLYQVLMSVHVGATVVLEKSFAFPAAIIKRIVKEEVTVFPGVPTVFSALLSLHRNSPLSMPSIKRITNTAAHLPDDYVPSLLEISPDALIFKMYGLTECKRVCYLEPELVLLKPSSVGKAIPGTETYLLDEDGQPATPGTTGTLYVRGPHVMMGYWNLPAETEHMLKAGKYPGERVLCTHDFFRKDADGFLYFVGRSDDIIKSRGEKVSPVEVENALATIPGVREAAVVGAPDELLGEAVIAYVVLDDGVKMSEPEFKRHAMDRLESFMVPKDVLFIAALPKTDTGKVRKKSLIRQP